MNDCRVIAEWKLINEIMPNVGQPVLGYHPDWKHPDFNPSGIRECFATEEGWCSAQWENSQDFYFTNWQDTPLMWLDPIAIVPKAPES